MKNKNKVNGFGKIINIFLSFIISAVLIFSSLNNFSASAQAVPIYDPNFIMSDDTFRSTRALNSPQAIQDFLNSSTGPLKNYSVNGRSAAQIIWSAARGETSERLGVRPNLNPGVILAYLEKEMSLVSIRNYDPYVDPQGRMAIAMGYGCPDRAKCNPEYYGFENQVNWASFQLQHNFNRSEARNNAVLPYMKGNTFVTLDEYTVTPSNSATAANYRYTPHVYWGNYNLWKIITANGWGVSSQRYTYSQIDSVNLPIKNATISNLKTPVPTISRTEGLNLVRGKYSFGQRGESIFKLQSFLRQEGYYQSREINGLYGTITPESHRKYRIDKKIIDWVFVSVPKLKCESLFRTNFPIGTVNDDVLSLQKCLTDIGIFDANLQTSYYGTITNDARLAALTYLNFLNNTNAGSQNPTGGQSDNSGLVNATLGRFVDKNLNGVDCRWLQNQNYIFGRSNQRTYDLQRCLVIWEVMPRNLTTGYFGNVTNRSIVREARKQNVYMCNQLIVDNYDIGTENNLIYELQSCFARAGFFEENSTTGYYGPITQNAHIQAKKLLNLGRNCYANVWLGQNIGAIQDCLIAMDLLTLSEKTNQLDTNTINAMNEAKKISLALID
jgi:peptidoglycan hydrolase-like protein with peptidoglycan-binding domain